MYRRGSHSSVKEVCFLDIGFRHMFSAPGYVAFVWCINRSAKFPPCAYTDVSLGVGSLVGWEISQSLGLVLVLRRMGLPVISITVWFKLMNSYTVLFCLTLIFVSDFMMFIVFRVGFSL